MLNKRLLLFIRVQKGQRQEKDISRCMATCISQNYYFLNRFKKVLCVYILHLSFYFIQPNFARGIYEILNYQICEYVLRFNSFYDEINQKGKICGTKYQWHQFCFIMHVYHRVLTIKGMGGRRIKIVLICMTFWERKLSVPFVY